jgi:hypothetical protein
VIKKGRTFNEDLALWREDHSFDSEYEAQVKMLALGNEVEQMRKRTGHFHALAKSRPSGRSTHFLPQG